MFNNINLNLYRIFYEVALSGSISSASKKLFITQSAVSKAIKKLEKVVGKEKMYKLLEENPKRVLENKDI